MVTTERRSI